MANYDLVYELLKFKFVRGDESIDEINSILEGFSAYDYKNKILDFPREFKNDLQDLVEILEYHTFFKAYYDFNVESKKNIKYSETRLNGGIAYYRDEFLLRPKLYPYVNFLIGNGILIEHGNQI